MEHLFQKSQCSICHNIYKYMIFQRRQKALLWSNGFNAYISVYNITDKGQIKSRLKVLQYLTEIKGHKKGLTFIHQFCFTEINNKYEYPFLSENT